MMITISHSIHYIQNPNCTSSIYFSFVVSWEKSKIYAPMQFTDTQVHISPALNSPNPLGLDSMFVCEINQVSFCPFADVNLQLCVTGNR